MNILVVVVTYNRRELLKKCLESIFSQADVKFKVLVIDNASTDDTYNYVKKNILDFECVDFLRLEQNIGGAGGFFVGMNYAIDHQYDWIWMMDDDGYPEQDCLSQLYSFAMQNSLDAISPLQIDIDDHSELAFPITCSDNKITGDISQLDGIDFICQDANLFNGLLIKRDVLLNIGLVNSNLFIRGDEVDYLKRMKKNNIKFGTLTYAYFFHPSDKNERIPVFFNLLVIRDAHSDFKNYYMFRNRTLSFLSDGNYFLVPLDFIRYSYYYLIYRKFNFKGLLFWCSATYDGLRGVSGRNSRF